MFSKFNGFLFVLGTHLDVEYLVSIGTGVWVKCFFVCLLSTSSLRVVFFFFPFTVFFVEMNIFCSAPSVL
jgi:hypothetical protein